MTVVKRSIIPIVCRARRRSHGLSGVGFLPEVLCDPLESVDLLLASSLSERGAGMGRVKSSAGTRAWVPLIVAIDFLGFDLGYCSCTFGSMSLPPLLYYYNDDRLHVRNVARDCDRERSQLRVPQQSAHRN